MRELNDPENPYLERYDDWDVWIYMHEVSVLESRGVVNVWIDHPGWGTYDQRVDANGFVVPRLMVTRNHMEQLQNNSTGTDTAPCTHFLRARGAMPWEMQQRMQRQETMLRARLLPMIPEWLTKGPPQWAMLLPDGDVVTLGEVGQGDVFRRNMTGEELRCYRYDADGKLLGWTEPGQEWWQLYFDFDAVLSQYDAESIYWYERNGFISIVDGETGLPLAVYNYDGTRLSRDHPLRDPARDGTRFMQLYGSDIVNIYTAQQPAAGRSI